MPGIVVSIDGKSTGFEKELARAEALATGMAKSTAAQVQSIGIASQVQLQKQMTMLDQLKAKVAQLRGGPMMSAADSAKQQERIRQTEVEEATRRNRARKLIREREETRTEQEIADAVENARRNIQARKLRRERAERRANAPLQGPDLDGSARQAASEAARVAAVEAASRSNRARAIRRERAEESRERRIEEYRQRKAAIFQDAQGGSNSTEHFQQLRLQRRIAQARAAAADRQAANFIGPVATIQQMDQLMANGGRRVANTFWGRFSENLQGHGSGGMQQLIHVGRATVDSLASGMSPWRVMMQQGPQAFQAFASMGGQAALRFVAAFGAAVASIGAIIAAPFIYFSRVDGLAERLAPHKLIDFSREYIPLVNRTAEGLYRMAKAAQRVNEEYNGATASAARFQKQLDDQFEVQKQLDALSKEREIRAAQGDSARLAEIEKRYGQLDIKRNQEKMEADKQAKIKEVEGLQKELADLEERKKAITVGDESKHKSVLETMRARAEDAKKLLDEENKRQVDEQSQTIFGKGISKAGKWFTNMYQSGGLGQAMIPTPGNLVGGLKKGSELGSTVDQAKQKDLELARAQVIQYKKLLDAENARNKAIEERNRLQGDSEKNSARLAQLKKEIADADAQSARATTNMEKIEAAKNQNRTDAFANGAGGAASASITERERIGARSGSGVTVSLLEVSKKHLAESQKHTTNLADIARALAEGGY